jgi:TolC family type I secretion outer membrane protein
MQANSSSTRFRRRLMAAALPALALAAAAIGPAQAQSLNEALARAYQSNPTLDAQRATLRATDELVPQARSGLLPTVNAVGSAQRTRTEINDNDSFISPRSVDLTLTQSLYRGGGTSANISRAENLVLAQRAQLLATEQSILLDAATAYLNALRDEAVLRLNINNEQVLKRQLEASQDRFNVGEITRTDVSQAQARLSRSKADRILSEGLLNATRAEFTRLVGTAPESLTQPAPLVDLPKSLDEATALAADNSPAVIAARHGEAASKDAIDAAFSGLLPSVAATASVGRDWGQRGRGVVADEASIGVRVTVPIYEAGAVTSQVREAKQTANQRRIQVEEQLRGARESSVRAWEALVTARASIQSRNDQVRSSEIALEGVRQEATVGSRTVLDVLDAEQELLDARVQLVRAQRDEVVAGFQVLAATGQLTASRLGLAVQSYDPKVHYEEVRDRLWGVSID